DATVGIPRGGEVAANRQHSHGVIIIQLAPSLPPDSTWCKLWPRARATGDLGLER
ncbi:MAG: hypothetical protein K0Q71_3809, partial [Thermomicrobiales bacterium]|nr:hypothetical protein [Thermomicrobiales bacterium]